MKVLIFLYSITYFCFNAFTQSYSESIQKLRYEHHLELTDSASHVLNQEEKLEFGGLDYFPIDSNFRLTVKFTKNKGKRFKMATSTDRTPIYRRYGYINFKVNGSEQQLTVYQNLDLKGKKGYENYLFIPFRDGTSGKSSYGGGRYLDFYIPKRNEVVIVDFNKAYNPYCAYSHRYSCPIPPAENKLEINIPAGEKTPLE